jgi:peptidoglycan/LPS O-acetylase OafA/YrhL
LGTLRVFLALSVVYDHLGRFAGPVMLKGDTAVQSFYVISGFYMSLVLAEKYGPGQHAGFWLNRFLRLWPTYAAVLAATVVCAGIAATCSLPQFDFVDLLTELRLDNLCLVIYFVASQIFLFGQDLYNFIGIRTGEAVFLSHEQPGLVSLAQFSPIPQAWTLGLEFLFYIMAPAILRRSTRFLLVLLGASLAIRMGLQFRFGLEGIPWSYRLFPSELALFVAGALAYRTYRLQDKRMRAALWLCALSIGCCLLVNRWSGGPMRVASVCFLVVAIMVMPAVFRATHANVRDRSLGDLSYPIYISHYLVTVICSWFLLRETALFDVAVLAGTILFSIALHRVIERPIERWRRHLTPGAARHRYSPSPVPEMGGAPPAIPASLVISDPRPQR